MAIAVSQISASPYEPPMKPLIEMYRRAMLELKATAAQRLIRDGRALTAEARRARVLIREVTSILDRLEGERTAWIAENMPMAYIRGVRSANLGLSEIGLAPVASLDPKVHEAAINVLVSDLQDDFANADAQIIKGFRRFVRRTQLRATLDKMTTERVAQGIVQGQARRTVSAEITSRLIEEYGDKPIRINGRNYQADKYAELVARTKTREANTAGVVNRSVESGLDLVMVTAHGAKDACGFWEGKVFSISGTSDRYPALDALPNGGPPFHPNCVHVLAPYVEHLSSGAEKRRAKGVVPASLGKPYGDVEKAIRRGDIKVPVRRKRKAV